MAFRIGQKVVCVNVDVVPSYLLSRPCSVPNGLEKGRVYTITGVGLVHPYDIQQLPCVTVAEIRTHFPYWAHRFRPAVARKTDISIFTEMLKTDRIPALSPPD